MKKLIVISFIASAIAISCLYYKSKPEKIVDMMKDDLNTMTALSKYYSTWDSDGNEMIYKHIDSIQKHMDSLGVELTKYKP